MQNSQVILSVILIYNPTFTVSMTKEEQIQLEFIQMRPKTSNGNVYLKRKKDKHEGLSFTNVNGISFGDDHCTPSLKLSKMREGMIRLVSVQ